MTRRVIIAMPLLAQLTACGRTATELPPEDPTVDAMIYALGFCSLKCWRQQDCGLTSPDAAEACEAQCVDDALDSIIDDPCWAEWIELRRCRVLEATCDGVEDETLPPNLEDVCEEREQWLASCEQ